MGKHIQTHLLEHKKRAEYGKEVFINLETEINISQALLRRMVQFYNEFPKSATSRTLTWSHYVELIPVKDREKRQEYIETIKQESLSVRELRELITDEEQKQAPVIGTKPQKKKLSF